MGSHWRVWWRSVYPGEHTGVLATVPVGHLTAAVIIPPLGGHDIRRCGLIGRRSRWTATSVGVRRGSMDRNWGPREGIWKVRIAVSIVSRGRIEMLVLEQLLGEDWLTWNPAPKRTRVGSG